MPTTVSSNEFTQAIFKPLELMSGAAALHIALAEAI